MFLCVLKEHVRICETLDTNRAGAKNGKTPHVGLGKTVHTNPPGTKNRKLPHVRICRTLGTNRWRRDSGDHLMPPRGPQERQNDWTVVQISIFKKMKHEAMDDDEKDNSNDGNANCMNNHELDGAICENVWTNPVHDSSQT